jgi:hypothetical protein
LASGIKAFSTTAVSKVLGLWAMAIHCRAVKNSLCGTRPIGAIFGCQRERVTFFSLYRFKDKRYTVSKGKWQFIIFYTIYKVFEEIFSCETEFETVWFM